ncbi:hypothetical protein GALMADRAFT_232934 [Galerina marginata CBS 339.88]|uniref:Anaphase-promoting complex subunit 4-like WD40 domain-containing protein n=1 Tax=Galerina marginata (strain CBS 339.88) TaxID=685588 RepID=A0A067S680_GALM3|nr:hypothetical protein GALMADRAFT_232934 [Galerina marginata CBS 339.88]
MSFFSNAASMTVGGTGNTSATAEKDIETPYPSDSSSSFSSQADYMAVGSWDNSVLIYEVGAGGQMQGKAFYLHQGPVLDVCWNKDGTKIFSGGADNAGRMFDVTTGQATQVARHDAPIRVVGWVDAPGAGILATGSIEYPLMVVGTAERHIEIFNLTIRNTAYKDQPLVYAVNDISFHPVHGTFRLAVRSDGTIHFWDKHARTRLKTFDAAPGPISATAFNRNGSIFAYAVSYDWSKGHPGMTPRMPNKIMLHSCKDEEVGRRAARK